MDNKILSTEHGPMSGDEINLISKNNNYGWKVASYGEPYKSKKLKYLKILGYFDNFHIGCVQACSFWLLKEGRGCFLLDVTVALKYNSFSFS